MDGNPLSAFSGSTQVLCCSQTESHFQTALSTSAASRGPCSGSLMRLTNKDGSQQRFVCGMELVPSAVKA